MEKFIADETKTFHDQNADEAITRLQTAGHDDIGNTAEKWAKAFQQVSESLYLRLKITGDLSTFPSQLIFIAKYN